MRAKPLFLACSVHHRGDCAVACLASLLQIPYEEVLVVAAQVKPLVLVRGLDNGELIQIAARFKRTCVERTAGEIGDVRTTIGMLGIRFPDAGHTEHAVVLAYGLIFDPEGGEVWKVRDYLRRFNAQIVDFLELEE